MEILQHVVVTLVALAASAALFRCVLSYRTTREPDRLRRMSNSPRRVRANYQGDKWSHSPASGGSPRGIRSGAKSDGAHAKAGRRP